MDKKLFKRLRKKPQWKLQQERDELQAEQKLIRRMIDQLDGRLDGLRESLIMAKNANCGENIEVLEAQIEDTEKKMARYAERYKNNGDVLEVYSKILKNDREGKAIRRNSFVNMIGTVGGLLFGGLGLKLAYDADLKGMLVNKGTLNHVRGLPLMRLLGPRK